MNPEQSSSPSKLCPTCGTRISEGASRCLVCGNDLTINGEITAKQQSAVQGSRMPEISLALPVAIGLLALFLAIGAGLVYFALRETEQLVVPTTTSTSTLTVTPSVTPTPVTPTSTPTMLPSPTPYTYNVVQGDTCLGIAFTFEVSIQSIILLNNLASTCPLSPGDILQIPQPTATATPYPTATLSGTDAALADCETIAYTVQEGDTLSTIATNYAVPISAIKEFNGMVNDNVLSGLPILIPLCERAPTPGPSPTPTPPPPYPPPNLLLPSDGAPFTLDDESITLQWASVGTLNANEVYAVTVEDITEGEGRRLVEYVRDTKFIIPETFRAKENIAHIYRWVVTSVRQVGTDESGDPIWDTAGATSNPRVFTWVGFSASLTPTP